MRIGNREIIWLGIFFTVLIWSGINPKDQLIWLLEVSPAMIALPLLVYTRRRFPLTTLTYVLILIHSVILMVGGHYTYAEVPFFNELRELFDHGRNNYDKLGHFAQGFVPAIIARELLIRQRVVNGPAWLVFIVLCICLAISAVYELLEWLVGVMSEEAAEAFLGTQGYAWDTQSDMGTALLGAGMALLLLGRLHDRQLQQFNSR